MAGNIWLIFPYDLIIRKNPYFSNHLWQVASARADIYGLLDNWSCKKWNAKTLVSSRNSSYRHKGWYPHYFLLKYWILTIFSGENSYNLRNDLFYYFLAFAITFKSVWLKGVYTGKLGACKISKGCKYRSQGATLNLEFQGKCFCTSLLLWECTGRQSQKVNIVGFVIIQILLQLLISAIVTQKQPW
jgi:hypothetical protein